MRIPEEAPVMARSRGRMTLSDLPPCDTKRWVASRKAAVVAAVQQKLISSEDACARYGLTLEELESWRAALHEHGVGALRATRIQLYRSN
ncbi:CtrA inhibitor SciP [Rubrimonas sp.]|uniref:CtrA inhibitor SciP n=1 Tax=Rubrimonas sp. TaxID=2036015 RepID=UPI002FDE2B5B